MPANASLASFSRGEKMLLCTAAAAAPVFCQPLLPVSYEGESIGPRPVNCLLFSLFPSVL